MLVVGFPLLSPACMRGRRCACPCVCAYNLTGFSDGSQFREFREIQDELAKIVGAKFQFVGVVQTLGPAIANATFSLFREI